MPKEMASDSAGLGKYYSMWMSSHRIM